MATPHAAPRLPHVALMAAYNTWMNARLYAAAATLPAAEFARDRQAFFGSLRGTLNHLLVADTIWLKRFADHPARHAALDPVRAMAMPATLDWQLATGFDELRAQRERMDALIEAWVATLTEADLAHVMRYANSRGDVFDREFFALLMHVFNHQTHHRGQATTLLSQAGVDVGVTDLLALIPQGAPGG